MKKSLLFCLLIIFLLAGCAKKNEETTDMKFDYNRVMQVEVAFNDNVKAHYEYMKANPEDTVWEDYYSNHLEVFGPLVDEFKTEKLHKPIVRGMADVNESADLVNTYYEKHKNGEDTKEIEQQITEKFTAIENDIKEALELGAVKPTKEMEKEVKDVYNQYLTSAENKDAKTYANLLWDEQKEQIQKSFEQSMENYTMDYELQEFDISKAYEDAVIAKVVQDMKYVEVPEGVEASDLQITANITFVKKDNEWKIYMEESTGAEYLQ